MLNAFGQVLGGANTAFDIEGGADTVWGGANTAFYRATGGANTAFDQVDSHRRRIRPNARLARPRHGGSRWTAVSQDTPTSRTRLRREQRKSAVLGLHGKLQAAYARVVALETRDARDPSVEGEFAACQLGSVCASLTAALASVVSTITTGSAPMDFAVGSNSMDVDVGDGDGGDDDQPPETSSIGATPATDEHVPDIIAASVDGNPSANVFAHGERFVTCDPDPALLCPQTSCLEAAGLSHLDFPKTSTEAAELAHLNYIKTSNLLSQLNYDVVAEVLTDVSYGGGSKSSDVVTGSGVDAGGDDQPLLANPSGATHTATSELIPDIVVAAASEDGIPSAKLNNQTDDAAVAAGSTILLGSVTAAASTNGNGVAQQFAIGTAQLGSFKVSAWNPNARPRLQLACPNEHVLNLKASDGGWVCDACGTDVPNLMGFTELQRSEMVYVCMPCDVALCLSCSTSVRETAKRIMAAPA